MSGRVEEDCIDTEELNMCTVPTRAEVQLQLTRAENERPDGLKGSAAWLAFGLKIDETRSVPQEFLACLETHPVLDCL